MAVNVLKYYKHIRMSNIKALVLAALVISGIQLQQRVKVGLVLRIQVLNMRLCCWISVF